MLLCRMLYVESRVLCITLLLAACRRRRCWRRALRPVPVLLWCVCVCVLAYSREGVNFLFKEQRSEINAPHSATLYGICKWQRERAFGCNAVHNFAMRDARSPQNF